MCTKFHWSIIYNLDFIGGGPTSSPPQATEGQKRPGLVGLIPITHRNCQFSSVAFALRDLHIFKSAETLKNEVVSYLNSHNYSSDGVPLELFAGIPWSQYITEMARSGTYGDKITLCTISNMFNAEIVVFSTLGQDGLVRIISKNSLPLSQITVGHLAAN